jgi:hypothetical protein
MKFIQSANVLLTFTPLQPLKINDYDSTTTT